MGKLVFSRLSSRFIRLSVSSDFSLRISKAGKNDVADDDRSRNKNTHTEQRTNEDEEEEEEANESVCICC